MLSSPTVPSPSSSSLLPVAVPSIVDRRPPDRDILVSSYDYLWKPVTEKDAITCQGSYAPWNRALISRQVGCNLVSFEKVLDVINSTLKVVRQPLVSFSHEHAIRCCVEIGICLNYSMCQKIMRSTSLGFGCDETPHQKAGRSFLEVHCFGVLEGTYWVEFICLIELFGEESKSAETTVSHLLEVYEYLKSLSRSESFPPVHRFHILSYDNCNTNTGSFSGVGISWDEVRSRDYANYITTMRLNPDVYRLLPTIKRGCKDHEAAMFGKTFGTKLVSYIKEIGRKDLIVLPKIIFIGYSLLKILSVYLGVGSPNRGEEFQGFCRENHQIKEKIFFRATKNRYCTYELLARKIGITVLSLSFSLSRSLFLSLFLSLSLSLSFSLSPSLSLSITRRVCLCVCVPISITSG